MCATDIDHFLQLDEDSHNQSRCYRYDEQGEFAGHDGTINPNMVKTATPKDIEYCSRTGRHIRDVPAKERGATEMVKIWRQSRVE